MADPRRFLPGLPRALSPLRPAPAALLVVALALVPMQRSAGQEPPPAAPAPPTNAPAGGSPPVPASAPSLGASGGAPEGGIGPSPTTPPPAPPPQGIPLPSGGRQHAGAPKAPPGKPAPPAGPPGAGPGRMNFELKFPPDRAGKGRGSAAGSAATFDYKRDDYAVLTGDVKLHYQDLELEADRAEIDLRSMQATAQGNVILDQGPKRLTGTSMTLDLDTKTGKLYEATAYVAPDYFFAGSEIDKTGDDTYTVYDGLFTSCAQNVPDWSFHLHRAEVQVEGYAKIHRATMRVKELPVFYTPYLLWPVKQERASGLLVPTFHYSRIRGASVGLAYFQTLGPSYDTTFHLDPYFRGFLGVGDEFRYQPTEGTSGDIVGYEVRDPARQNMLRWKVEANHVTEDLPGGMRAVVHFQRFSDFDFLRDFERDFDRSSLRFFNSRAFVSGSWGPNLVNLLLEDRQTFQQASSTGTFVQGDELRRLPELQYQLRSIKIGPTPFYGQFQGAFDFLDVNRLNSYRGAYGRFDVFPQLTLPIHAFPWLSLSIGGGERYTYYSKSLVSTTDPLTGAVTSQLTGGSLSRALPFGQAEIVGPSVSKIFSAKIGEFGKFKHVIEPRVTYTYLGQYKNPDLVPLFDQVDVAQPITATSSGFASNQSTNAARVALDSRLLAKPDQENASAREILFFEIARTVSFDSNQPLEISGSDPTKKSNTGPLDLLMRFNPGTRTSIQGEVLYSTFFGGLESTSLSGNVGFAASDFVGLTWFVNYRPDLNQQTTLSNQIRLNTALNLWKQRLSVQALVGYDVQNHLLQQQFYSVNYNSQCYGLRFEMRQFRALVGPRLRDTDFRFSLSLKNVGKLFDINSRSTVTAP